MSSALLAIRVGVELKTLAAGSVAAGYTAVGTPLSNSGRFVVIQNLTDQDVMFSIDGTNDAIPVKAGSFIPLPFAANRSEKASTFEVSQGTQFYVKRIGTPTTGSVYISSFYGNTNQY